MIWQIFFITQKTSSVILTLLADCWTLAVHICKACLPYPCPTSIVYITGRRYKEGVYGAARWCRKALPALNHLHHLTEETSHETLRTGRGLCNFQIYIAYALFIFFTLFIFFHCHCPSLFTVIFHFFSLSLIISSYLSERNFVTSTPHSLPLISPHLSSFILISPHLFPSEPPRWWQVRQCSRWYSSRHRYNQHSRLWFLPKQSSRHTG